MSLTSCLTKANGFIDPAIERTLLERAESLEDRGQAPLGASRQAVQEAIDQVARQLDAATSRAQEVRLSAPRSTWYSGLQRAVEAVPERLATMAAPQWRLWLDANAAKLGVKKDEIEWSGVKDYLETRGKDKVTKTEIADYLSANGVKIEETVLGGPEATTPFTRIEDAMAYLVAHNELGLTTEADVREEWGYRADRDYLHLANNARADDEGPRDLSHNTKYSGYTVPGGQNYRELLLTLPSKEQIATRERFSVFDEDGEVVSQGTWPPSARSQEFMDDHPEFRVQREVVLDKYDAEKKGVYRSSHWAQANVLAHIRVDDRTDADGKRVLFINEIQSDWGADGRKQGFMGDMIPQDTDWTAVDTLDYADTRAEAETKMAGLQEYLAQNREPGMENRLAIREANGGFEVVEEARSEAASAPRKSGVPRAPFITDTKAYVALALKRAIKLAVDEGYDRVALVTGEQAADFFSLAKQINSAKWEKNYADGRLITLEDKNGDDIGISVDAEGVVYDSSVDGAEGKALDDVIGKDLASKIMDEPSGSLRGLELNVGGTGMKTYYNELVPNVLRDVLKKLGGGKMETIRVGAGKPEKTVDRLGFDTSEIQISRNSYGWGVENRDDNYWTGNDWTADEGQQRVFPSREAAEASTTGQDQPGFTLTPAMKEKAEGGMAMFSAKRDSAAVRAGADAIAKLPRSVIDDLEPGQAPGGYASYALYEARKLMPKPSDKIKKVSDSNSLTLWQNYDWVANVDGELFGINKSEDPDYDPYGDKPEADEDDESTAAVETGKWNYNFSRVEDGVTDATTTWHFDKAELIKDIRASMSQPTAADEAAKFSPRRDPDPVKTVKAYKLFRMNKRTPGKIFPLFVNGNDEVPLGQWLDADSGELANGKVKSKIGPLAYRPGWHAGDVPVATHIGEKTNAELTAPDSRPDNHIWAEVEMAADRDWQSIANERGTNKAGKIVPVKAHITDQIPKDGFYRYKTNSNMTGNWLIGGSMRVTRLLSDAEVTSINQAAGVKDLPRQTPQDLSAYGLQEGDVKQSAKRDPQTETAAFKKWFGDSQAVNTDGSPRVLYHGTVADFSEFKEPDKAPDLGFHFGTAAATDAFSGKPGGRVMPVYLSLQNPLRLEDNFGRGGIAAGNIGLQLQDLGIIKSTAEFYRIIEARPMRKAMAGLRRVIEAAGYDSVVYENMFEDAGQDSFIAFKPEQIKSATGNNGDFDPASKDITLSTGRTSTGAAWESPIASKFDDLVYKLQDKQIETKRVIEAIKTASGGIADDVNVYLNEEMFHGRAAKRTEDFVNLELNPMIEEMARNGLTIADVEEFLHARHAQEANAVIAQRNPNEPGLQDGGSGMTNAEAANYLANLTQADRAKLQTAADKVNRIIRETRKMYVDYDLESQETIDAWDSMFQNYIPLQREDKTASPGIGQGFSIKGKETKGRTGSTRKVVDILANVAMQRERAIVRGEKNRVAKSLVGLAQANDNADFWTVDEVPTERVYNPATGLVEERADPMYKNRDNAVVAKIRDANGIVREHAVVFNEDDPRALRMAVALKNLDATQLEGLLGVSAKITRYFAAINTQYNPVFGIVNLVRDVQGAMLNLTSTPLENDKLKIARSIGPALKAVYADMRAARKGGTTSSPWAVLWEEFQTVGGQTGYRDLYAASADRGEAIEKALNPTGWMDSKLGKVFTANGTLKVPLSVAQKQAGFMFDWLSDYNGAMENGVRLAAYKAGLDRGLSKEQAASIAKNLTTNFNRKGQVSQQAGAMYAFFNAAVQGTARIGDTLFDMEPGKPKTLRLSKTGKKIVYGGILLGSVQAMALAAAGFGDEDPPEFTRERSVIIPTGGKTYISIPMPLGMHIIPNIGRVATEFALSGFKDPIKRSIGLAAMFADAFNPIGNAGLSMQTLAPTALDPLVALTENKDWTGKAIAKTSFNKATPGHTLGRDTSTAIGEFMSEAINTLSGGNQHIAGVFSPTPDQIDYLLGQVTGGVGREYSKVEQSVKAGVRGETLPTYKIPLVGRFVGNAEGQASEGSAFYANADRLNEIETEVKGLKESGKTKEANALLASRPEAYLITQANYAENQARKLRKQKSELIKAGAPREDVRAIEEKITAVMARLNRAMEKIEAAKD